LNAACILAAGRGTRMGATGRERPKGFIEIGGEPIVARSVRMLRGFGIERVVVVTGHLASWYDGLDVERVYNPEYETCGSLRSLAAARDRLDGPFLLLESDLVYEKRALDALLADPHEDAVLLSGPTGAGDEVVVETRDGFLVTMSKDRARVAPATQAELVGISRISPKLYRALLDLDAADASLAYETDGLAGCARTIPIHCPLVADLRWGEIDDDAHLERVLRLFTGPA
jgi:2-aminoethylphosphonate-pyruvate transaminase